MLVLPFRFNIVAVRILLRSNFESPEEQREQNKHGLLGKVYGWAATIQWGQLGIYVCAIEQRLTVDHVQRRRIPLGQGCPWDLRTVLV
jgi:hypothetical protein